MNPLPFPVRIAAGLVATAVEQARELPRLVVEFPVTAISQALQASMRMQQRVTELAIKGDRALSVLRPAEEEPAWATFDDDVQTTGRNGASTVTELRPVARPTPPRRSAPASADAGSPSTGSTGSGSTVTGSNPAESATGDSEPAGTASSITPGGTTTSGTTTAQTNGTTSPSGGAASDAKTAGARAARAKAARTRTTPTNASRTRPPAKPAGRKPGAQGTDKLADPAPRSAAADVAARTTASAAAAEQPADTGSGSDDASGPNIMPGLRDMTIPQLRARLRKLNERDLRTLLAWETAHDNRPPFVTMLSNRITTVTEG